MIQIKESQLSRFENSKCKIRQIYFDIEGKLSPLS